MQQCGSFSKPSKTQLVHMHVFNLNYRGSIPSEHFRSSMWLDLDGTDDLELESHFQRNPKEYRMMTMCLNYIKYA